MVKLIELFKESTPEGVVAASKAQVGHALGLGLGLGFGLGFRLGLGLGSGLGLEHAGGRRRRVQGAGGGVSKDGSK